MAASATVLDLPVVISGPGGARVITGTITFDSDATVEVPVALTVIKSASFVPVGSGGNANTVSIDETAANGVINVPSSGNVTVDATANNTDTFLFTFIGY